MSRAGRGAGKIVGAAQELRRSPALQHALAARERGNFEAAFWLLAEEFRARPRPDVAVAYWDAAIALGRVDLAAAAGVMLVETHTASGEVELAAQYWIELVSATPDVLVAPTAIATMLPALRDRLAAAPDDEAREAIHVMLRRAMRHAVDPRNEGLHAGVALRLFEEGREFNPEATRRAAEVALESPHLHEAKRERLRAWLSGKDPDAVAAQAQSIPVAPAAASPPPESSHPAVAPPPAPPVQAASAHGTALSSDEISAAAARVARRGAERQRADPASEAPDTEAVEQQAEALEAPPERADPFEAHDDAGLLEEPDLELDAEEGDLEADAFDAQAGLDLEDDLEIEPEIEPAELEYDTGSDAPAAAEIAPEPSPQPMIDAATPTASGTPRDIEVLEAQPVELAGEALVITARDRSSRIAFGEIEAIAVAEVSGLESEPVRVIDLLLGRNAAGRMRVLRLRPDRFDPKTLVPGQCLVGGELAAFLGELLERSHAVPLPDPESALGLRVNTYESLASYEDAVLRRAGCDGR